MFQVIDCLISEQLVPFSVFLAGEQGSELCPKALTPVNPALRRLKPEDPCEFQAGLSYREKVSQKN